MMDFMNNQADDKQESSSSLTDMLAEQDQILENDASNESENGDTSQEFLTSSVGKSNLKNSTMVLVAIFAIGAGTLLLMIKNATPQAASAAQSAQPSNELDLAIAKLSGIKAEMFKKMDDIARKFEEISNIEQISVNQLKRNPFRIQLGINNHSKRVVTSSTTNYLTLDSIIQSDNGNMCMIDGNVYSQGDNINGYIVETVGRDFVRLQSGNNDVKILRIN